jgi:hypothetical protein
VVTEALAGPGLPEGACTLLARIPSVPVAREYLIEIDARPGPPAESGEEPVAAVILLGFWSERFAVAGGEESGCTPLGAVPALGDPVRTEPPDPEARGGLAIEGRLAGDRCSYGAVWVLPPAPRYAIAIGAVPLPGERGATPVPAPHP